ncbi:MAG: hypothetical protein JWO52_4071 [Gammaproteobacteria bacterium]|nr:hypothetical protein [Gammaproteobacteria bacterium]
MKTYSLAPDVEPTIKSVLYDHHGELIGVRVGSLFVFDDEDSLPVLTHQGYPAQAMVKITPVRDRTLGMADVVIMIDRATWLALSQPQRDGLIDHELTHVARVLDKESGRPKFDALGRPKLRIRPHDYMMGWFDEVAQRHGDASPEVRQAKQLMESSGQLYFDFRWTAKSPAAVPNDPDVTITVGDTTVSGKASDISGALRELKARSSDDPEMLIWWQHGITGECWSGKRREMPQDCVEIDPPAGGKSDQLQRAAETEVG